MNILTINALQYGGAANAARQLHEALLAHGHTGTFVCCDPVEPACLPLNFKSPGDHSVFSHLFKYWRDLSSAELCEAGASELFSDSSIGLYSCALSEQLVKQADIVHIHWMAGVLFSPQLFTMLMGKKIVWTLHDMNPFTGGCHYHISCRRFEESCGNCPMLNSKADNDLSVQCHQLKKALYEHLDIFPVGPSAWLARQARKSSLFAERAVAVIPNAHDTAKFSPQDRDALRVKHDIADDVFVILAGVESLDNPRKNMASMLEAVEIFTAEHPDVPVELILFGGSQQHYIASYPIWYTGTVDRDLLVELYNLADVFVHPSRLDNLSNTLCEAQCCGAPVVAFEAGGNAETFLDGVSGFVAEESPEGLAAAIRSVFVGDRFSMREKARSFAVDTFAYDTIAREYTVLYEECARKESVSVDAASVEGLLTANATDSMFKVTMHTATSLQAVPPPAEEEADAELLNSVDDEDASGLGQCASPSWFRNLLDKIVVKGRKSSDA